MKTPIPSQPLPSAEVERRRETAKKLAGLEDLQIQVDRLFAENQRLRSDTARLVAESRLHVAVSSSLVRRQLPEDPR